MFCRMLLMFNLCARDGVSEGQFSQVLLHEMNAIRQVMLRSSEYNTIFLCSGDFQCLVSVDFLLMTFVATC